jgi:hypothetical protein
MKKAIVIGIIFLFIGVVFQPAFANDVSIGKVESQPFDGAFMKTFGGTGYDSGKYVQQTTDGGFIIIGSTPGNVWLIKTDNNGNMIWNNTLGIGVSLTVQQTSDGGYIITGYKGRNVWLIKTDSAGNKEWDKTFGGSAEDRGYYGQQTTDGGYVIIGYTNSYGAGRSDVWLIKTDNNGNMMWNRTFGGDNWDEGYSGQQTADGGYIITGRKNKFGSPFPNVLLIKTDGNGTKMWEKTHNYQDEEYGLCVQQTSDGGYIITGYTELWGLGWSEVLLLKTDRDGNRIWVTSISYDGFGYSVRQTTDGGYIVTGIYDGVSSGLYLIKTSRAGTPQWERVFGGVGDDDIGYCVQQTNDEGYIIVGETESYGVGGKDVWLIKTNKVGEVISKAVAGNMLLLRILERFPLLQKLILLIK